MQTNTAEKEKTALAILRASKVDILDAAILARQALALSQGKLRRAYRCLTLGNDQLKATEKTVSFQTAAAEAVKEREKRRWRTLTDFRYIARRLIKANPSLGQRRIRSITTQDCEQFLHAAFTQPRQYNKARAVCSGIFSTACRKGWCHDNPVRRLAAQSVKEHRIAILRPEEINQLLHVSRQYRQGCCLSAVALMLYAGIRPHEVARLTWGNIDLIHGYICIMPQHSKTGGARRVTIHKPLRLILQHCRQDASQRICPPNWINHWRIVRKEAGWGTPQHPWQQDALRHTFASYHLAHFKDFSLLQWEIGHRDSTLLRQRYVDMRDVGDTHAFWNKGFCD